MTLRTIQPIGNRPYAAPNAADASAAPAGIPNTAVATASAEASPRSAAQCAFTRPDASAPSSTTTGSAATSVDSTRLPNGSYVWGQGIRVRRGAPSLPPHRGVLDPELLEVRRVLRRV